MRPGRVKGRRRRREGTFIWFRPAAITMEKMMRTPLATGETSEEKRKGLEAMGSG